MARAVPALVEKFKSPMGQKLFRYSMASVVAVVVSNVLLLIFVGVIDMSEVLGASLATGLAAIPSYEMNRKWAWGKTGKSHILKEVVPFWGLAFLGWGLSTLAVWWMGQYARHHHFSHLAKTLWVLIVYFAAFGVLWVGKFVIFNSLMFVHHHHEHHPPERDEGEEGPVTAGRGQRPAMAPVPAIDVPGGRRGDENTASVA